MSKTFDTSRDCIDFSFPDSVTNFTFSTCSIDLPESLVASPAPVIPPKMITTQTLASVSPLNLCQPLTSVFPLASPNAGLAMGFNDDIRPIAEQTGADATDYLTAELDNDGSGDFQFETNNNGDPAYRKYLFSKNCSPKSLHKIAPFSNGPTGGPNLNKAKVFREALYNSCGELLSVSQEKFIAGVDPEGKLEEISGATLSDLALQFDYFSARRVFGNVLVDVKVGSGDDISEALNQRVVNIIFVVGYSYPDSNDEYNVSRAVPDEVVLAKQQPGRSGAVADYVYLERVASSIFGFVIVPDSFDPYYIEKNRDGGPYQNDMSAPILAYASSSDTAWRGVPSVERVLEADYNSASWNTDALLIPLVDKTTDTLVEGL